MRVRGELLMAQRPGERRGSGQQNSNAHVRVSAIFMSNTCWDVKWEA